MANSVGFHPEWKKKTNKNMMNTFPEGVVGKYHRYILLCTSFF